MEQNRWDELCKLVEADDGLPVRDAGEWTRDKLFYWHRYLEITTNAMVGKPQWRSLTYIDLFAGPGVCRLRESGLRFPGSCLLAAYAPKAFGKLILCEENPTLANALSSRLTAHNAAGRSRIVVGDCNERIDEIVREMTPGDLNVAFVDPTGLHHRFETIERLTHGRRVDLLILFADRYDIHRNKELYSQQDASNLDEVLGPNVDWRTELAQIVGADPSKVCKLFADIYTRQLHDHLGYDHFGEQVVLRSKGTPLYRLIYASKHSRGVDFWNKAVRKHASGQTELF